MADEEEHGHGGLAPVFRGVELQPGRDVGGPGPGPGELHGGGGVGRIGFVG